MAQVTLTIPEQNIPLLLEVTRAMGIEQENILINSTMPDWHKQILQQRMEEYKSGSVQMSSWDNFKRELKKEDEQEL